MGASPFCFILINKNDTMNINILCKLMIIGGILGLCSCSEDDKIENKPEYEVVDNVISSWDIILSNYYESIVPSNELFCIAESEECPLTNTYISIVNYDSEYPLIIPRGVYMENEHGIWIDRPVAASQSIKEILNADYYTTFVALYGGEGTYNFAIRIYNPVLDKYYITRTYQLKIKREWVKEEFRWYRSISLAD